MFNTTNTNIATTHRKGPGLFSYNTTTKFELFIGHEDFPVFLAWSTKVKAIYSCFIAQTVPSSSEILTLHETRQGEDDLRDMACFIQSKCMRVMNGRTFVPHIHFVPKGAFADVDSWIDASILALTMEFKRCMDWYVSESFMQPLLKTTFRAPKIPRLEYEYSDDAANEAIAVKYAKYQTDILTNWVIDNVSHPFPNPEQVRQLTMLTGLNASQIINWTTNVRKRNMKATLDGTKKPHHFLDFLFLASEREKNEMMVPMIEIKVEDGNSCHGKAIVSSSKPIRSKRRNSRKGKPKNKGFVGQNMLPITEVPIKGEDIVALPVFSTESIMPPMPTQTFPFDMSTTFIKEEMPFTRLSSQPGLISKVPRVTPPKCLTQQFGKVDAYPKLLITDQARNSEPTNALPPADTSNHHLRFDDMSQSDLYLEELDTYSHASVRSDDAILEHLHTRAIVETPINTNKGDNAYPMDTMYNYENTFERHDPKDSFDVPQQGKEIIENFKNCKHVNIPMQLDNEVSYNVSKGQEMIEDLKDYNIENFDVPPGQIIKKELFNNFSFERCLEEEFSGPGQAGQGMIIDNDDDFVEKAMDMNGISRLEECGVEMDVDEF